MITRSRLTTGAFAIFCLRVIAPADAEQAQGAAGATSPEATAPAASSKTPDKRSPCDKPPQAAGYAAFVVSISPDPKLDFGGTFLERANYRCAVAVGEFFYAGDILRVKGAARVNLAYFGGRYEPIESRDVTFDTTSIPPGIQKKLQDLDPVIQDLFPRGGTSKPPVPLIGSTNQGAGTNPDGTERSGKPFGGVLGAISGAFQTKAATRDTPPVGEGPKSLVSDPVKRQARCSQFAVLSEGTYLVDQARTNVFLGWKNESLKYEYKNPSGQWADITSFANTTDALPAVVEAPQGSYDIRVQAPQQPEGKTIRIRLTPVKMPESLDSTSPDDKAVQAAWLAWGQKDSEWKVEGFSQLTELAPESAFARQALKTAKDVTWSYDCNVRQADFSRGVDFNTKSAVQKK